MSSLENKETISLSVISPMYNEAAGIEEAVLGMLTILGRHEGDWEFIVVNDGSTDDSLAIVRGLAEREPRLRIVSYGDNRGRGYALRQGFAVARGEIIVTTEADSSWGEMIVFDFLRAFAEKPRLDMIVASPHLSPGGYANVPFRRVLLSQVGNLFLRFAFGEGITMFTGMCRAYRRRVIDTLELDCNGKEIHLEILSKAGDVGFVIGEIPATLAWKNRDRGASRPSSFRARPIIASHLRFAFNTSPFLLLGTFGSVCLAAGTAIGGHALLRYAIRGDQPTSLHLLLIGLFVAFGLQLLVFCYLAYQNRKTHAECYRLTGRLKRMESLLESRARSPR